MRNRCRGAGPGGAESQVVRRHVGTARMHGNVGIYDKSEPARPAIPRNAPLRPRLACGKGRRKNRKNPGSSSLLLLPVRCSLFASSPIAHRLSPFPLTLPARRSLLTVRLFAYSLKTNLDPGSKTARVTKRTAPIVLGFWAVHASLAIYE
jgi:hypothetical protein